MEIFLSGKTVFQHLDWLEYFQRQNNKCSASKAFNKDMIETNSMGSVIPRSHYLPLLLTLNNNTGVLAKISYI